MFLLLANGNKLVTNPELINQSGNPMIVLRNIDNDCRVTVSQPARNAVVKLFLQVVNSNKLDTNLVLINRSNKLVITLRNTGNGL